MFVATTGRWTRSLWFASNLLAVDDNPIGGSIEGQRATGRLTLAFVEDRNRRARHDVSLVGAEV